MNLKLIGIKLSLKNYWQELALVIFFTLYLIYFTTASILRYINYYTGRFDLGNMDQTVWNTLNGNIFMLTDPNGTQEISRLAVHADFILILFAPLYMLWSDPRMLLIIQTIVLALGGVFVYLIAKKVLKNKNIALVFSFAFYLNPLVQFTNLYDFHSVTLATTFLLAGFYFILEKKWKLVLLFLFLAGITKEQVWAINALLGIYIVLVSKEKIIGSIITVMSSFMFIFLFWIAIPNAALGSKHFALDFFTNYGQTPHEVIKNILLNPIQVLQDITSPEKKEYLIQLLQPLGFLSIFGLPFLIFAIPDLSINLLSNFTPMHQIWYQYTATITPFLFIAAIYGIKFLKTNLPMLKYWHFSIIIIFYALYSAQTYGPLWFSEDANTAWYKKPLQNREIVNNYINSIPIDKSVSATNNIGSHMSQRKLIYVMPKGIEIADYVLFLRVRSWGEHQEAFLAIQENENFILDFKDNDFFVFKRISP